MKKLGLLNSIGYIITMLMFTMIAGVILGQFFPLDSKTNYIIVCLIQIPVDVLALFVYIKLFVKDLTLAEIFGIKKETLLKNILIGVFAYAGIKVFMIIFQLFLGDPSHGTSITKIYGMDYFSLMCQAVIIAPFREELMFRGLLQPIIKNKAGTVASILVTAIVFTFMHTMYFKVPLIFILLFVLALTMGILRHKTDSVVPSYILHLMFNAHI